LQLPVIELGGFVTIILAACFGVLSHSFFLQFVIFRYAFATVISIGSVLQEELTYKRYNDWQDVARLVRHCFLEHFPYRQLHMIWRLARPLAVFARRPGLETAEAAGHAIPWRRLKSSFKLLTTKLFH
jgi:hypothetical protein